ncbi:MAG: phage tail sheath family protein [Bryobacteraceae bacterium]
MPQLSYPGVYIEEVPSGVRTITAVPTSIAAFVDFFSEGPMNEAVLIQGMTDFGRVFGGLDDRSDASYGIAQFFLNGGQECYVVRVARDNPPAFPLAIATAQIADETVTNNPLAVRALSEGAWGNNIRIDIDGETEDPATRFNLYARRYDDVGENILVQESFLNLGIDPAGDRFVETIVNDESTLVRVTYTPAGVAPEPLPAPTGTIGADIGAIAQGVLDALGTPTRSFTVNIGGVAATATLAAWPAGSITPANLAPLRTQVQRAIRQADPLNPAFASATVDLVDNRLVVRSGKGADTYLPEETIAIANNGPDTAAAELGFDANTGIENVQEYRLGAGAATGAWVPGTTGGDGDLPSATEVVGSQAVDPPTGMFALDPVDLFNMLCIPRAAEIGLTDDAEMSAIVSNGLAYCAERRAFMIVDIPSNINTVQEMRDWIDDHAGFRQRNAAIYFPRLEIPDPLDDFRLRNVAPSGTIAGVYARTDSTRGVWKAPAGIEATLDGVPRLAVKLTDRQNGTLNMVGVNCLRTFPINGNVVWGARTLLGADSIGSEWKYASVRRLALNLQESLFRGTKWVVFEPNDEPLWANIRLNVGAFMNSMFRRGAFQGTSPKEAYFVKCDRETTTQNDRNQGIVNIEVGFAPLNPAEFVVIKIQQMRGDL